MTQEHYMTIDLTDIGTVKFECKCGAAQAYHPDGNANVPQSCNQCGIPWTDHKDGNYQPIQHFINSLKQVRLLKIVNFRLCLTVPVK